MIDLELIALAVSVVVGTGGASRIGASSALNGIYKRLDRHELKIDSMVKSIGKHGERIARMEGKQ